MKWSKLFLQTLRDAPSDAEIPSHKLMSRAGLIKKIGPGLYTYQTLALRSLNKLSNIIRKELNSNHCQEVLMPMVQPRELWEETNRWTEMGDGLLKFKNRNEQWYCLGATHEEVVTDLVRHDLKSYKQMPVNIYQIQTKYRDEIRPRFGLMRGREFLMKDAYSFDVDPEAALKSYDMMYQAYQNIFDKLGLDYRIVQADAGNIGGSKTHEFQMLAEAGEDHLMVCDKCKFAANIEVAPALSENESYGGNTEADLEKFATPGLRSISSLSDSLKIEEKYLVKTMFYALNEKKAVAVLLRGCDEVNPIKLKNILGLSNEPLLLNDQEVLALTTASPGSCSPIGLKIYTIVDESLKSYKNFIVGANQDDFHYKNANFDRDIKVTKWADIRMAKANDKCPSCADGKYQSFRGIEVGHCFYLGTKYSKAMNATFLDKNGKNQVIEMGCYGIGVSRTLQAAIEQSHDQDGIVWPVSIAPYHVHIVLLDPSNTELAAYADKLYADLNAVGIEVFMDDRDERPGVKFKDADLLGMPVRINLGAKGFAAGEVEVKNRKSKEMHKMPPADVSSFVKSFFHSQLS